MSRSPIPNRYRPAWIAIWRNNRFRCDTKYQRAEGAMPHNQSAKWKHDGVRVIPAHSLDPNTAQTPGMDRKAAINYARVGAQKIWAGTVSIQPNAKTGAH